MPTDYEIDPHLRLIRNRLWGVVTYAELTAARERMTTDPAFSQDFDQLADFSEVTVFDVSAQEVREFATGSPFSSQSRRALVVTDDVAFGLARMYENYHDALGYEAQIRVFRSRETAEEWLGLSGDGKAARSAADTWRGSMLH